MNNRDFLRIYLRPLRDLMNISSDPIQNTEFKNKITSFLSSNDQLTPDVFRKSAREIFGDDVESANRFMSLNHLSAIKGRLTFIVIFFVIALISSVIATLAFVN